MNVIKTIAWGGQGECWLVIDHIVAVFNDILSPGRCTIDMTSSDTYHSAETAEAFLNRIKQEADERFERLLVK